MRKKRRGSSFLTVLIWLLLIVMLVVATMAGYKLYRYYKEYDDDRDRYEELRDDVILISDGEEESTSSFIYSDADDTQTYKKHRHTSRKKGAGSIDFDIDWDALKAVNEDIIGWVYFTGLPQISYPILQAEDNDYYVHRTYDLSSDNSKAGCIFMDYRMNSDFSSPYSIIYGHNVHDGSMLSDLPQLKDQSLYDAEPYFWILAPQGNYRYQIFSIFQCHRSADVFQKSFTSWTEDFLSWQQELKSRNTMQGDVELQDDSHIIAFSTCVPNSYDRTIVCGVYIDGDKIPTSDAY